VIIAFAMVVLLLFAMSAVDISFAYVQRRQMQNAADAAALAGARELTIAQGMGDDATLTNGGLYGIILDWAQRNQAQTVQALYIRPDGSTFSINKGDGATVPNFGTATGVYVNACTSWPTFFSRFVGLNFMNMCAEAEASYGAVWAVRGMAPLAVLYSDFQVGDEYSLFSGNYKHTAARWGWLGLDCQFPSKCSPDANALQNWMAYGYQGYVARNSNYMADPGMKETVLHHAQVGQVLILPLFDKIYQYTTAVQCDKNSPHYDPDYCANACKQEYTNVVCTYTDVSQLKGQYYYHIIAFAAFEVSVRGQHQLDGRFVSYIVDGTWTNPSPWDKGVVVMRLTERDKPTVTPVGEIPAATATSTPVVTPRIVFDDPNTTICVYDPEWRTVCGTVELPEGTSARLQTSWYVVHPDNTAYAQTQYVDGGIVQNGSRFCIQAYWPGIRPEDMIVEIHIGGVLLDPNTNNPIMAQGASLDYYWYHWYCPAPTPGATATPVPPTSTPAGPTPTATVTPTPCSTPSAPTALSGWRSGDNVYLSWNAPSGPPPNGYRIYWATTGDGQYGFLTSTTSTSYSYKTNGAAWYYVKAYNTCGEGPASEKKYVPAK
jgi:hypothetical protein